MDRGPIDRVTTPPLLRERPPLGTPPGLANAPTLRLADPLRNAQEQRPCPSDRTRGVSLACASGCRTRVPQPRP